MKKSTENIDIYPKVVRAGALSTITIIPDDPKLLRDGAALLKAYCYPMERSIPGEPVDGPIALEMIDDHLALKYLFTGEQEYVVVIKKLSGEEFEIIACFRIYSLEDDLYKMRPFKGDFHIHSERSDGHDTPAYVAGACRRIGMDFMAVTDHGLYAPSIEAIDAFQGVEIDLRIYPGEEIHPPECPVHMINFGGRFSINECFKEKEFFVQVADLEAGLPAHPDARSRRIYAICLWCYNKVREAAAISIFCHPYWVWQNTYNVSEAIQAMHFRDMPFDALELIGGYRMHEIESNLLQVARYYEERAQGRNIPIVGASDAHGCECDELFGRYCTIIFAKSTNLDDIRESIRELRTVAIEALPGQTPRAHGPFRMVKLAQFLMREVFPDHDNLCRQEGLLMLAHLSGDFEAAKNLFDLKGQVEKLMDRVWNR